jgi:hypothetical protein
MPFRINVELKDGSVCLMGKKSLNVVPGDFYIDTLFSIL